MTLLLSEIAQENQWRFDCHGMVLSLRSNSFFKEKFRGRQFLQKYSKPLQHQRLKWEAGHKQPTSKVENLNKRCNKIKMSPTQLEQECRVIIESDEEIDQGFSYLLEEKGTECDIHGHKTNLHDSEAKNP